MKPFGDDICKAMLLDVLDFLQRHKFKWAIFPKSRRLQIVNIKVTLYIIILENTKSVNDVPQLTKSMTEDITSEWNKKRIK